MRGRILLLVAAIGGLGWGIAGGGEIIILEPAAPDGQPRTQREAERSLDKARDRAGKKTRGGNIVILGEGGDERRLSDRAEDSAAEAREYLAPPPGSPQGGRDGVMVIRSAVVPPPNDAEKARMRARSYIVPDAGTRECAEVSSNIGTIGEGATMIRSENVREIGTSNVNRQGRCR